MKMIKPIPFSSKVRREANPKRKKCRKHRFLGLPPRAWAFLRDFCQESSLHGLKYVCSANVRYIER